MFAISQVSPSCLCGRGRAFVFRGIQLNGVGILGSGSFGSLRRPLGALRGLARASPLPLLPGSESGEFLVTEQIAFSLPSVFTGSKALPTNKELASAVLHNRPFSPRAFPVVQRTAHFRSSSSFSTTNSLLSAEELSDSLSVTEIAPAMSPSRSRSKVVSRHFGSFRGLGGVRREVYGCAGRYSMDFFFFLEEEDFFFFFSVASSSSAAASEAGASSVPIDAC